mmetsp:Transcript_12482/g.29291  ORF Transcript_12482/g.29291 Transcript_12482/m.29291 type:complete len:257 (-) Transcript_12482:311-1081(-)
MRSAVLVTALLPAACVAVASDDATLLVQRRKEWTANSSTALVELLSAIHVAEAIAAEVREEHKEAFSADQGAYNCTEEERQRMSVKDSDVLSTVVKRLIKGAAIPPVCYKATGKNTIYDQECLATLTGISQKCARCHTLFSYELPGCAANTQCSNLVFGGLSSACVELVTQHKPTPLCVNTVGSCMSCISPTLHHHYDCKGGLPPTAYSWMDEYMAAHRDGSILAPGKLNSFIDRLKSMIEPAPQKPQAAQTVAST